ncbi:MAG TPA: hypothetical protein VIJ00_13400, partial [Nakamurella sp.]
MNPLHAPGSCSNRMVCPVGAVSTTMWSYSAASDGSVSSAVNSSKAAIGASRWAPTAADAAPNCSDPLPCSPTSSIDDLAGIDLAGWVFPRRVL